jgi:hypothetical protein
MSPQPSIAHYRITSKLGEDGVGAVYRATDTKLIAKSWLVSASHHPVLSAIFVGCGREVFLLSH